LCPWQYDPGQINTSFCSSTQSLVIAPGESSFGGGFGDAFRGSLAAGFAAPFAGAFLPVCGNFDTGFFCIFVISTKNFEPMF
jgi:hypothetical protein